MYVLSANTFLAHSWSGRHMHTHVCLCNKTSLRLEPHDIQFSSPKSEKSSSEQTAVSQVTKLILYGISSSAYSW